MNAITKNQLIPSLDFIQCGNKSCSKNSSTLLKCGLCRSKMYCGKDCQKADWPWHKQACQLKAVKNNLKKQELENESKKEVELSDIQIEKPMPIPGLRLIENFISDDLHERFIQQMEKGTSEVNEGHYDGYCFENEEAFNTVYNDLIKEVFANLKKLNYFSEYKKPLKLACTLIGYEKDGFNKRHVDSDLFSAGPVVAISFNSPVVVNFYSENKVKAEQYKIFVPPKSMYSMEGEVRYKWSHAILKDEDTYNAKNFTRGQRYVVLLTPPGPLYLGTAVLDYE